MAGAEWMSAQRASFMSEQEVALHALYSLLSHGAAAETEPVAGPHECGAKAHRR